MSKLYEVDPDADTLIILSTAPQSHPTNGTVIPSRRARDSSAAAGPQVHLVNGVDTSQPGDLRIKASSKHLSLASRPLKKKLATAEGNCPTVQFDGRVHLRLEGFDPSAVTIAINALHGKSSRVPKSLDLSSVADVAAFVQTFQCHEAVEAYAERWIARLNTAPPTKYTADTVRWIFVSYVFRQPDLFRAATRTAISQGSGLVTIGPVRIPDKVINGIETKRQELVGKVVSILHDLVTDLKEGKVSCTQGCDLVLLGSLVKALHQWDLAKPYYGVSFTALARSIRELQDQVWCVGAAPPSNPAKAPSADISEPATRRERFGAHYCGIRSLINPKLYSLEVSVDGIELDDVLNS